LPMYQTPRSRPSRRLESFVDPWVCKERLPADAVSGDHQERLDHALLVILTA
jgi:hypothetical protein